MKIFFYLFFSIPALLLAQTLRNAPGDAQLTSISDTGRAYFPCFGTIAFSETFDLEIPAAWDTLTLKSDSVFPTLSIQAGWHWYADSTDGAMRSVSWFYPSDTANAWLFLPRVLIPSNACLSFKATSIDKDYPESYSVYLSQTDRSVDTFLNYPLLNVSAEGGRAENVWRRIDLSAYAGDSLYIAIHHNSYDKFILELDSFILTAAQDIDAGVYTIIPLIPTALDTFNFSGAVANYGMDTVQSVEVTWQSDSGPAFTFQYDTMHLAPGKLFWFTHPDTWIPDTLGNFSFCFSTSNPNLLTDIIASNDTFCLNTDVNWFVGFEESNKLESFSIYPNPVQDFIKIETKLSSFPIQVNMFSSIGTCMYSNSRYWGEAINLVDLSLGMYFVKMEDNNGNTEYKKIVKIR
jgi:hypothetical protein